MAHFFDSGDAPYLKWLDEHPSGLVLNLHRSRGSGYAVLHRGDCRHISGPTVSHGPDGFTSRQYVKLCADEGSAVVSWLRDEAPHLIGDVRACRDCNPDALPRVNGMNTWLLQGNPQHFDIDQYLSRYPFIYWTVNRHVNDIVMGDEVYIWRAGPSAGVVARGVVTELPDHADNLAYPSALGTDLWVTPPGAGQRRHVGVNVIEARLTMEDGLVPRGTVAADAVLKKHPIITFRVGTVFKCGPDQATSLRSLWWNVDDQTVTAPPALSVMEGGRVLRSHYSRERRGNISQLKKKQVLAEGLPLACEICGFDFADHYPADLVGDGFIEAHHTHPIGEREKASPTSLDDLMLVCSNCHRMLHRTADHQANLTALRRHFGQ